MTLVDDDEPKVIGRRPFSEINGGALDGREDVLPFFGEFAVDVELTERAVAQHLTERGARLLEDLASMREKEEPRARACALARPQVVEGSDDGLPRSGRGDDEVAKAAMKRALGRETVEDLELERKRLKREEGDDRRLALSFGFQRGA